MTPMDRVMARLAGKPVDRVPNLSILMSFAARYAGFSMDTFCTDYRALVEANIRCCRDFGIDMLNTMSDAYRETADFGTNILFPYDSLPLCKEPLLKDYDRLSDIRPFNPNETPRCCDRIAAVSLYRERTAEEFPVLGWVEGCFAEAADLRGINNVMMDLYDDPEHLMDLMEIILSVEISFARCQIEAGAHFIGIGDAAASLVSPDAYRDFVLPFEQRLISAVHSMGAQVKLHICGDINHLLTDVIWTGADIVDIDWMVDMERAVRLAQGHCVINGNFDPVAVMLKGTIDDVKASVKVCIDVSDGHTFISPGCEVPLGTPVENLYALKETLEVAKKLV